MKILSIECSAQPVSAAIICDGKVLSYTFSNIKLTHSQTLFPIIESALDAAKTDFSEIDAVSVSSGPGSFTGLRIGIACAKGLSEPNNLKCVGVSSLMASAYMFLGEKAVICPVIDARCGQVYNALFEVDGDKVTRLCDDRAIMTDDLICELDKLDKKIILCCDAAESVMNMVPHKKNIILAPPPIRLQSAVGVGLYAACAIDAGDYTDAAGLNPVYLKLPQAQRELKAKQSEV